MSTVHRPLAMLAALAAYEQHLPASARDLIIHPLPPTVAQAKVIENSHPGPNRRQRRILAAKFRGSGTPNGSKLSRKAAEGKL